MAQHPTTRMNIPRLKGVVLRIKADDGVGGNIRFAVPDRAVWKRRYGVWPGSGSAGRRPFVHFTGLGIEAPKIAALVVGIVNHVVGSDGEPARPSSFRQEVFFDFHRL